MVRPAVREQLLPGGFRRAAIAAICVSAAVVASLGALFAHKTQASAFDNAVSNLIQGNGGFGPGGPGGPGFLLRPFGMLGSTLPMTLITALLVYCCLALRRYQGAVMVAAGVVVASSVSEFVLKPIIDRTRYGSLSFPSGHATAIFAIATAIAVLLIRPPGTNMPTSMRTVLAVLTYAAACAGSTRAGRDSLLHRHDRRRRRRHRRDTGHRTGTRPIRCQPRAAARCRRCLGGARAARVASRGRAHAG